MPFAGKMMPPRQAQYTRAPAPFISDNARFASVMSCLEASRRYAQARSFRRSHGAASTTIDYFDLHFDDDTTATSIHAITPERHGLYFRASLCTCRHFALYVRKAISMTPPAASRDIIGARP